MNDRIKGMLGLAKKAGKLVSGEEMVLDAIRSGKAGMVIVTTDASDNSRKLFHDKCSFYRVPVFDYGTREDFGHVSMAVTDRNFADSIKKLFN